MELFGKNKNWNTFGLKWQTKDIRDYKNDFCRLVKDSLNQRNINFAYKCICGTRKPTGKKFVIHVNLATNLFENYHYINFINIFQVSGWILKVK